MIFIPVCVCIICAEEETQEYLQLKPPGLAVSSTVCQKSNSSELDSAPPLWVWRMFKRLPECLSTIVEWML